MFVDIFIASFSCFYDEAQRLQECSCVDLDVWLCHSFGSCSLVERDKLFRHFLFKVMQI